MKILLSEIMLPIFRSFVLILVLVLLSAALLSCNDSGSSRIEMWGVFKTEDGEIINSGETASVVSTCNDGYRSTASNIEPNLWRIEFSGDSLRVYDVTDNTLIASGNVLGDTLSFNSVNGMWSFSADYRKQGCCFDGTDGNSTHWHGIRMPDFQEPSGIGQGECDSDYISWYNNWTTALFSESEVIETQAGPVEYSLIGDSGPVMAFSHGGPGSYYSAVAYFSDLMGKGFRALTWSRPGFLRTPLSTGPTPEDQADALAALLDALSIDSVAVVGASAGGPPAYQFAIRHPSRTWAVVQVDAISRAYSPNTDPKPGVETWLDLLSIDTGMWLYNAMFEYASLGTARQFIGMMSTMEDQGNDALAESVAADRAKMQMLERILMSMAPNSLLKEGTFNDISHYTDMAPMPLEQITAPTLIVHGTADGDVPPEDAVYAASRIASAELYWVENGIHVVNLSQDSDVAISKILTFLDQYKPE